MKCEIHRVEMEYKGESPFGDDLWFCQICSDEEEYIFSGERFLDNNLDFMIDDDEGDDYLSDDNGHQIYFPTEYG